MAHALVLNASLEPLCVVPLRRAVVLVLNQKAVVVERAPDRLLHSERTTMDVPVVVRLRSYVRVPYRRGVPLTRRAVLERDAHRCAYCPKRADTVDHVIPRSRGGQHAWTNVVAACCRCNHRKGDALLADLGWELPFTPGEPPASIALVVGWGRREPLWEPYLALAGVEGAPTGTAA
ncbi:5-methylcytosine-specific restriction endonuclease McrA [Motilibacter rhizosphaerae]|uniref:5-methylcytosine-specific restriction endonuclease McrA n=1 Tax=Motilibacter rhizosphaerae TaxID=598652 RepID=A0A4Q7NSQ8_9ACTN|nr:HNH endonuclease [Motilibacter rhizosphaerae]RZS89818.1 5-methylcytosine-specific restriction endonuclease McrA [Motilibacter rhizosphaerae]